MLASFFNTYSAYAACENAENAAFYDVCDAFASYHATCCCDDACDAYNGCYGGYAAYDGCGGICGSCDDDECVAHSDDDGDIA